MADIRNVLAHGKTSWKAVPCEVAGSVGARPFRKRGGARPGAGPAGPVYPDGSGPETRQEEVATIRTRPGRGFSSWYERSLLRDAFGCNRCPPQILGHKREKPGERPAERGMGPEKMRKGEGIGERPPGGGAGEGGGLPKGRGSQERRSPKKPGAGLWEKPAERPEKRRRRAGTAPDRGPQKNFSVLGRIYCFVSDTDNIIFNVLRLFPNACSPRTGWAQECGTPGRHRRIFRFLL